MMNIQRFAAATGTFVQVKEEDLKVLTLVAVDATAGIVFDTKGKNNDGLVIVAQNTNASAAKNVTIKAPTTGSYAKADEDITLSVAAGGIAVARISTAKYADNTGKVTVTGGSADVKVQMVYR